MFAKGTLAAGLLAAALAVLPGTASAGTHVNIGVGVGVGSGGGSWCYYHPYQCGGGYGGYPYRYPYYRPYYAPGYYLGGNYGYGYGPAPDRIGCREARDIVYNRGYRNVSTVSCGGKYNSFRATRKGLPYLVKVNTWTGGVIPYQQ